MTSTDAGQPPRGRAAAFLFLALAGLLAQLTIVGVFLADHGLDFAEAGDQLLASPMAVLSLADLTAVAVVYLVWMPREAARAGIDRWWPFALALAGGVCFALPLFLYARERRGSEAVPGSQPAGAVS